MSNPDNFYTPSDSTIPSFVAWQNGDFSNVILPSSFPQAVPVPKYGLGSRCRWVPAPSTDWGTIIGYVYSPYQTEQQSDALWSWLYLLLLDTNSPSRRWIVADWVDEEDLELLYPLRSF